MNDLLHRFIFRNWALKLAGLFLGTIWALLEYYQDKNSDTPTSKLELFQQLSVGLTFSLVVFLIEQVYELDKQLENNRSQQEELTKLVSGICEKTQQVEITLEKVDKRLRERSSESEFALALARHKSPLADAMKKIKIATAHILLLNDCGYTIKDHSCALENYLEFWRALVFEQKKKGKTTPLNALILHSCSIHIWQEDIKADLLYEQKEFIEAGGKIDRILCSHEELPNEEYGKVAREMASHKINVGYYSLKKGAKGHDFTWDFLFVPQLNQAVIWKSDDWKKEKKTQIKEAIYVDGTSFAQEELPDVFMKISKDSITIEKMTVDHRFKPSYFMES